MLVAVAVALFGGCAASDDGGRGGPVEEHADLVLWNGRIATLDDAQPEVAALAARGDRLVALGDRATIEPLVGPQTTVVDLEGALAVPGLIDAHAHFLGIGDAMSQLDLREARSWEEIVRQVEAAVAEADDGAWIRGFGWHQAKWDSPVEPSIEGYPVHASLSAVSPEHPVLLTHASGHASFANRRAMELAGVDASTEAPPGGEILHDASGQPTGLFNESAATLIDQARSADPATLRAEVDRMIELASGEVLAKGLTSFHDAGTEPELIRMLHDAAQDGRLGVRLWMMVGGTNEQIEPHLAEMGEIEHPLLNVGGIKRYMDGALGSRGAWLLEPYSDQPDSVGLALAEIDDLRETARLALAHDLQLAVHAIGDRANREVLDLYAEALVGTEDRRWRIEHAQHLSSADIGRFAELGVIASMQPVHATSDGPWVPDRLGQKRSEEGAYLWRTLLDSGATVISGTDAPVEDVDPLANFRAAVTRAMSTGEAFYPAQAMRREEALASMTRDAAWAVFEGDQKGTLEVGKFADVTVLSHDILEVPVDQLDDARVLYTIVGGEVAYRATP
ncbi:MAG: amidohydrolase [Acidobacteriota bacterium]